MSSHGLQPVDKWEKPLKSRSDDWILKQPRKCGEPARVTRVARIHDASRN